MSQKLDLQIKGIDTASNQLSGTPEGSFTVAKNVSITKGVAECRRGFDRLSGSFSATDDRADVLTEYQDKLIVHRSNDDKLLYYDSGSWTEYSGTYSHPDSDYARMKFLQTSGNLLFTSSTGIKTLDAFDGTVYNAGMPKGLDGEGSVTGSSGFLSNNAQVAYRVLWGTRDANNNLFLGSPSQRILVANAIQEVSSITCDTFANTETAKEVSTVTCDTKANTLAAGYIDVNSSANSNQYRFWMDTTGVTTAPSDGGRTLVQVDISGDTTANDVASTLQGVIDAQTDLSATVLTDTVTITNRDPGECTDISKTGLTNSWAVAVTTQGVEPGYIDINSANDTNQYRFWFDTTGTTPDILSVDGRTLVKVDISGDTTASDVATALEASIEAQTGFSSTVSTDTITVTNDDAGTTTDISSNGLGNAWDVSVTTSASTRDVSLTFTIPNGIDTSDFYQIYRSKETSSATDEPNDELQLVYEGNPTSGEISAQSVTLTDSTPVSLMGAFLYSNESQEGIAESNDEPPFAQDLAEFKGFTFYANIKRKHYLNIKLLSVGGSNGIAVDDTITINGDVYTAKASENAASAQFQVYTTGSASQNIADTARSLVKVINQYSSNTEIAAYYESGYNDLPGQILLRTIELGYTSFAVSVNVSTAWDVGTGTSDNEEYINGFSYSKNQQPEHVPLSHLEFVGSKNYPIRRCIALRDSLFFLKDDGIFKLTGSAGQWSVEELDGSTKILAPESAVVLNNQIYCFTDQGVVGVSDVGVKVFSEPIKDQIFELIGTNLTNLKTSSFGIGYETDRKYYLFCPATSSETTPSRAFVLDTFTNKWTEHIKSVKHGIVKSSDDKLYLANTNDKYIINERKSYTFRDFIDEEIDGFSIVSSSGTSVVLNTVSGLSIGDLLFEDSSTYSPIEAIDASSNTVTVRDTKSWSTGATTIYQGISCELEWTNIHCDNPGIEKSFNNVSVLFKNSGFSNATLSFYTDVSGGFSDVSITGSYGGGAWGLFPWGGLPWGGVIRPAPKRVTIPRNKKRGTLLSTKFSHRVGYGTFEIQGLSLQFHYISERLAND